MAGYKQMSIMAAMLMATSPAMGSELPTFSMNGNGMKPIVDPKRDREDNEKKWGILTVKDESVAKRIQRLKKERTALKRLPKDERPYGKVEALSAMIVEAKKDLYS